MSDATEAPQYQFQGLFIPATLLTLLQEGEITATDLLLLAVIESLIKHPSRTDPEVLGCYATNAYLAKAVGGVADTYVSTRVNRMRKMGLIYFVHYDDKRHLETTWSRIPAEVENAPGGYGKALRKAYQEAIYETRKNKPTGRAKPCGKDEPPPFNKTTNRIYIEDIERNPPLPPLPPLPSVATSGGGPPAPKSTARDTARGGASVTLKATPQGPHQDGVAGGVGLGVEDTVERHRRAAAKLRAALHGTNQQAIGYAQLRWAEAFRMLECVDRQTDWEEVLDWYCDNASVEARATLGLPSVATAKQFRARFGWIRDRMASVKAEQARQTLRNKVEW